MSYEPTIIIYKPDLDKRANEILLHQYGKKRIAKSEKAIAKQEAYDKLESILVNKPFALKGVKMLMVDIEFTSINKAFRQLLTDLHIEYIEVN